MKSLLNEMKEFASHSGYAFIEVGRSEGNIDYTIEFEKPAPTIIPTIIGDAVHNIRSSLDLAISELAVDYGADISHLNYPFGRSQNSVETIIKKKLSVLPQDLQDIIGATEPRPGGHLLLSDLHDLDIADKHRSIIPTYLVARGTFNLSGVLDEKVATLVHNLTKNLSHKFYAGNVLSARVGIDPFTLIELDEYPQPAFAPGYPLEGHLVLDALDHFHRVAEALVAEFECWALEQA